MVISRYRSHIEGPEHVLEQIVISSIMDHFGDRSSSWWAAASFPIGASRPDILLAAYEPRVSNLVESTPLHVDVISYLYAVRRAKAETISARIKKPIREVMRVLDLLTDWEITKQSSSAYCLNPIWRRVLPRIVSIEVKVKNWKRAIQQAKLNLAFSHELYVALPEPVAKRIMIHKDFISTSLGLISLDDDRVTILQKATPSSPSVPYYYFKLAAAIARTN